MRRGWTNALSRFSRYESARLRICERNGWSLAFFRALDDVEKDEWFAWDRRRLDALEKYREAMADKKLLSPEVQSMILMMSGW